ncbi:adenosylhomocysteinase [Halopenitus sp. H-Gu1]|uniref:adenosylhomocysteinase n=1 Tax=Halopenitus sp. H-Gu1 TaxID=3242697 RepID=UPI00359ED1E2
MDEPAESDAVDRVAERAPLLRRCGERFREREPFSGLTIGISAPITPHTGLFVETIAAGDAARVIVTGEAGTTHGDVVERLEDHPRIRPLSRADQDEAALRERRHELVATEPDLVADDGANLLEPLCEEHPAIARGVHGACEQTTGGITRLRALEEREAIPFPIYDVNGAPMKRHFDNVHGTAESSLSAIANLTNAMIAGSRAAVVGYGHCGRGIASKLRSLGARTVVAEVDPRKALRALADGHDVAPATEAVRDASLVITATGRRDVVGREQLEAMADGTVLASIGSEIEIDVDALAKLAVERTRPEAGIERFRLPDGRTIRLLAEGRVVNLAAPGSAGNPIEVMDTTFVLMARSLEALAAGTDLGPGLHSIPERLDREIAHEKLASMDVTIDESVNERRSDSALR